MKKNDVFTFTAPNGVEVIAVVVSVMFATEHTAKFLCYAQNRLFSYCEQKEINPDNGESCWIGFYGDAIVDYAILPDYDSILSKNYPQWEQNLEEEIQGMNDK